MKIIILNGPPRSGKDTVVETLRDIGYEFAHLKFAQPLRDALCGLRGIRDEEIEELKKQDPTVRQAMIKMSEDLAKPLWGEDYFAEEAAKTVRRDCASMNVVVSDGGFQYEVEHFISQVRMWQNKPAPEFQIWQIHRPFHDFSGDSREWVRVDKVDLIQIKNSTGLASFKAAIWANAGAFWGGNAQQS